MNSENLQTYKFALCKEMLETADVIRRFDVEAGKAFLAQQAAPIQRLFLTGEGSSRLLPGKNAIATQRRLGGNLDIFTEGATQALEYVLDSSAVLGASNSGKTKELIRLFKKCKDEGHAALYGLTAHSGTPLGDLSEHCHVLSCGNEDAVAATKSVVEQALVVLSLLFAIRGEDMPSMKTLGDSVQKVLTDEISEDIVSACAKAKTLYFAGRNDGVAEELTLKTNEITRKKSAYLEGTYAVHGIEEVLDKDDVMIIVNPFESEEEKFETCLKDAVGMTVIAISTRPTRFPTILIPEEKDYQTIVELCSGWNLLVEIGLKLGIDLDKPERARKVGNEYTPE